MHIRTIKMAFLLCLVAFHTQATVDLSQVRVSSGEAYTYQQLLVKHDLPALSVAVIDNYQVVFSTAVGVKNAGSGDKIDQDTAFNAGSIAKPIVATLAVILAEQGKLDLDVPVSQYLKTAGLSESLLAKLAFISLRQLLTHTAGTSHGGYASKYRGDVIPTTLETLRDYKGEAIEVLFAPGAYWKYSGGGYLIAQLVLQEVTGHSLAILANDLLFKPLGMKNSTFYYDGQVNFLTNVAKAHNRDKQVIATGLPICPAAACGLWTNARDMAQFLIEMQNALAGKKTNLISNNAALQLVALHTTELSGGWSMGWMRHVALGNLDWFSHSGFNHGTGGLVMATVTGGRGIVVFGNGDHSARVPAIEQITASVVTELGWRQTITPSQVPISKQLLERLEGEYENLTPHYFSPFAKRVKIVKQGEQLGLVNSESHPTPLPIIFIEQDKFRVNELVNSQLGVVFDAQGTVYITLEHEQQGQMLVSKALRKITH
ncbi:serine hydrolase domain-containing protein [Pseudoalteromonas fenneropenaei]|uniref:Serine hydrolase domain-containing protein n=1 Tax=Pseudoalteromonas fenneropenaei TaxID=1737459 RepID=A0ABV7CL54_9GAMM